MLCKCKNTNVKWTILGKYFQCWNWWAFSDVILNFVLLVLSVCLLWVLLLDCFFVFCFLNWSWPGWVLCFCALFCPTDLATLLLDWAPWVWSVHRSTFQFSDHLECANRMLCTCHCDCVLCRPTLKIIVFVQCSLAPFVFSEFLNTV